MGLRFDTGDSAFYDSGKTIKDNRLRDSLEKEEPRVKSFGERLRREREMRGVSLDEIAHTTKIGTRLLKALEDEQFELLPGGIFNKGFVRAYAKYLGIDEEQAVAAYLEAAGEREPDVRAVAEQNSRWDKGNILDNSPAQRSGFPVVPVLILCVVVAAGFGGWRIYQQRQQEREREPAAASNPADSQKPASASSNPTSLPEPSGSSTTSAAGSLPATASPSAETASSPPSNASTTAAAGGPAAGASFEVTLHTKDSAWVSIKVDGNIQTRGVLEAGQSRTMEAKKEVVLWTGNAGALEVTFNGKSVPIEAGPNEVRVLVFTPNGLAPTPPPKPRPVVTPPVQTEPPQTRP